MPLLPPAFEPPSEPPSEPPLPAEVLAGGLPVESLDGSGSSSSTSVGVGFGFGSLCDVSNKVEVAMVAESPKVSLSPVVGPLFCSSGDTALESSKRL